MFFFIFWLNLSVELKGCSQHKLLVFQQKKTNHYYFRPTLLFVTRCEKQRNQFAIIQIYCMYELNLIKWNAYIRQTYM